MTPLKSPSKQPLQLVITGSGSISLGAYRSLYVKFRREISMGNVTITIISPLHHHVCYGWMPECLLDLIPSQKLNIPLEHCFKHASIIYGSATMVNPKLKEVLISKMDGTMSALSYDQLVIAQEYFPNHRTEENIAPGFNIQSTMNLDNTRQQLQLLASKAAMAKDRITASRILRITVGGPGFAGLELAGNVAAYLRQLCRQYPSLTDIKPIVYLVANDCLPAGDITGNPVINRYLNSKLKAGGVKLIDDKQIISVNTDGAMLHDGGFINCSQVIKTGNSVGTCPFYNGPVIFGENSPLKVNKHWQLKGYRDIWLKKSPGWDREQTLPAPLDYIQGIRDGNQIGANITRCLEQQPLKYQKPTWKIVTGNMGNGTCFARVFGIALTGWPAWITRVILLLYYMPFSHKLACLKGCLAAISWKNTYAGNFKPEVNPLLEKTAPPVIFDARIYKKTFLNEPVN